MPKEVVELLRTEELNALNKTIPFMVHVLSTRDEVWKLNFNYWGGVDQYVFITWWNDFVVDHRLHEGQTVEIWSFRYRNETLCFAINIRDNGASKKEARTSSPVFTNRASKGGHGGNDDGAITIKA
ncbi:hypothetical protein IFM89_013526 [Coptis chinensis]|uniref:TF-B3 domain-containing protein n=1 Tax=Coptis chinensis TaxID=261450 RepID=A0A835LF17_9MAGN|nr:hypothetical protein IFM89_013526 [Coptis chinensis]